MAFDFTFGFLSLTHHNMEINALYKGQAAYLLADVLGSSLTLHEQLPPSACHHLVHPHAKISMGSVQI